MVCMEVLENPSQGVIANVFYVDHELGWTVKFNYKKKEEETLPQYFPSMEKAVNFARNIVEENR